jgi:hypothetical protein
MKEKYLFINADETIFFDMHRIQYELHRLNVFGIKEGFFQKSVVSTAST